MTSKQSLPTPTPTQNWEHTNWSAFETVLVTTIHGLLVVIVARKLLASSLTSTRRWVLLTVAKEAQSSPLVNFDKVIVRTKASYLFIRLPYVHVVESILDVLLTPHRLRSSCDAFEVWFLDQIQHNVERECLADPSTLPGEHTALALHSETVKHLVGAGVDDNHMELSLCASKTPSKIVLMALNVCSRNAESAWGAELSDWLLLVLLRTALAKSRAQFMES